MNKIEIIKSEIINSVWVDTKLIFNSEQEVQEWLYQMRYKNKTLERAPGQTLRETVENEILMINGKTRKLCGKIIEASMTPDNNALIVAKIKARGSIVNTINMSGMVGQQSVRGSRLTRGYKSRTLTHFEPRELGACAKGFIPHSFYDGLTPVEHFFQSMGGRDSMVIKALRTGRSGLTYAATRITTTTIGITIKASTILMIILSYSLPMSAADTPKRMLSIRLMMPTPKPTSRDVRAP